MENEFLCDRSNVNRSCVDAGKEMSTVGVNRNEK